MGNLGGRLGIKSTFLPEITKKPGKQCETTVLKKLIIRQWRTVSPETRNKWGEPFDYSSLLPGDSFQVVPWKVHSRLFLGLRRHNWEFREAKAATFCRAEYQRKESSLEEQPEPWEVLPERYSLEFSAEVWSAHMCAETLQGWGRNIWKD